LESNHRTLAPAVRWRTQRDPEQLLCGRYRVKARQNAGYSSTAKVQLIEPVYH
jgi:hypothetical protein